MAPAYRVVMAAYRVVMPAVRQKLRNFFSPVAVKVPESLPAKPGTAMRRPLSKLTSQ